MRSEVEVEVDEECARDVTRRMRSASGVVVGEIEAHIAHDGERARRHRPVGEEFGERGDVAAFQPLPPPSS